MDFAYHPCICYSLLPWRIIGDGMDLMKVIDCQQNSDEWFAARLGHVTASNFDKVLNKKTGRGLYMRKLANEKLTGQSDPSFRNDNMDNGTETEADAREYYQGYIRTTVEQVGFVEINEWVGASPDGLVGDDGLVEIKCPIGSTHIDNIETNKVPTCYTPQIQGQLWVTDRAWCDFVSYYPYMVSWPLCVIRVERDEEYISRLAGEVKRFISELKAKIERLANGPEMF